MRAKAFIVVAVVAANVLILAWRHWLTSPLPAVVASSVPLADAQRDLILQWQQATSLPLSDDGIAQYLKEMSWGKCMAHPSGARSVDAGTLADSQQADLREACAGLLRAYGAGAPEALIEYMADRGQRPARVILRELKRTLQHDGRYNAAQLAELSDEEVLVAYATAVGYAARWTALVDRTACATVWSWGGSVEDDSENDLGREAADLFRNQTRFHHLFVGETDGTLNPREHVEYELFADVQFVIRHDQKLLREPSPYFVRFGFHSKLQRWQPLELVHVPTISGMSPILIF